MPVPSVTLYLNASLYMPLYLYITISLYLVGAITICCFMQSKKKNPVFCIKGGMKRGVKREGCGIVGSDVFFYLFCLFYLSVEISVFFYLFEYTYSIIYKSLTHISNKQDYVNYLKNACASSML